MTCFGNSNDELNSLAYESAKFSNRIIILSPYSNTLSRIHKNVYQKDQQQQSCVNHIFKRVWSFSFICIRWKNFVFAFHLFAGWHDKRLLERHTQHIHNSDKRKIWIKIHFHSWKRRRILWDNTNDSLLPSRHWLLIFMNDWPKKVCVYLFQVFFLSSL